MDERESLIAEIVKREWEMFQGVESAGGRASCQDDFQTFCIMRSSQSASWSDEVLQSYLEDLIAAGESGRNLISEKYARMMESTSPAEYAAMAHLLPEIEPEASELAEKIVAIVMEWEKELHQKYPYILGRGRLLSSSQDSPVATSLETYLRGELKTYSIKTLKLYLQNARKQRDESINGSAITMLATMKQYGFNSLEEANEAIKSRSPETPS